MLAACGLWLAASGQAQEPPPSRPAQQTLAQSSGLALEQALVGIFGYTRWPTPPPTLRLCVVGSSPHATRLLQRGMPRLADMPPITVRGLEPGAAVAEECDAVYVGQLEDSAWRRMLPALQGRPVLTICERSPVCAAGGMLCLDIDHNGHVQFEINLDSVARSTVRVHPQVLQLGRRLNGRKGS